MRVSLKRDGLIIYVLILITKIDFFKLTFTNWQIVYVVSLISEVSVTFN